MNDSEVKTDRRIRKTKKAIKSAFVSLAVNDDLTKITVKDISDLADINRKTFYTHYNDIPAVVDDIENDIVGKLFNLISNYSIVKLRFNPYPLFIELTKIINEDFDFYHWLVNASISVTIFDKVNKMLKDRLMEIYSAENTDVNSSILGYALNFTTTGLLGVYKEWFNSDRKISLEDLSKQVSLIVFGGLNAIIA